MASMPVQEASLRDYQVTSEHFFHAKVESFSWLVCHVSPVLQVFNDFYDCVSLHSCSACSAPIVLFSIARIIIRHGPRRIQPLVMATSTVTSLDTLAIRRRDSGRAHHVRVDNIVPQGARMYLSACTGVKASRPIEYPRAAALFG